MQVSATPLVHKKREKVKLLTVIGIAFAIALLLAMPILARTNPAPTTAYDLGWYTIDGGGATFSTGGEYSLGGTIGQPDAGTLSGGSYALRGGFWVDAADNVKVHLPMVVRP